MNKSLIVAIVTVTFSALFPLVVGAQVTIAFPSCTSPSGAVIASYSEGIHGIVGDTGVYTGSDTVYLLDNGNATQCFCPTNGGAGIQTNWLKASGVSESEIDSYISQDWIYVITGVVWGLSDTPYLAKNSSFTCSPAGGGEGGGGSGGGDSEEGSVLGVSQRAAIRTPAPTVMGDDIAVLPATGASFFHSIFLLVVRFFAYVVSL